jgi:diguanylate cyclase (GGDEF)-like protein
MHISIKTRLFLSHFLAVALVSGSIGTYFYFRAVDSLLENLKTRLSNAAAMAVETIDVTALDAMRSPADTSSPAYLNMLKVLRRLRSANSDIAYIYIMRKDGPKTVFVLDSDETKKQALPGTEYPNPPAPLLKGFDQSSVDDRLYQDAWGVFMSGYAPIRDGKGSYLLGMDMRDAEVSHKLRQLRLSGLISLALSLGLAFLFATILSRRINRPLGFFVKTCAAIAEGQAIQVDIHTGDELDKLALALNDMAKKLAENQARRAEAEASLKQSKDEMESKVKERTSELEELNARLVIEIEERKRAGQALIQAAMTDPLTGLLNRRAMQNQLSSHVARVKRGGAPFVVLLCDVDRFKSVNDAYGHEAGDQLLRLSAETLQSSIRAGDIVSRWGGEEFLILLADTDLEGGRIAAENLREAFAGISLQINGSMISRTLSIGLMACLDCQDVDQIVRYADEALYEAKNEGKNRVIVSRKMAENRNVQQLNLI